MSDISQPKRRDFLKTAAMGAAGAVGLGSLRFEKASAQTGSTSAWINGMQINPAIDNKRVICCHDPKMLTATPSNTDFETTNAVVDPAVVAANLDEMARQLTRKTNVDEAWSTIFRIGAGKTWATARVAMKTNGIGGSTTNRPKWAIFKKICDVLIKLGVQPANIVLFDACDDASTYYNPHISPTDTTMIRAAKVSARAAGMGGFKAANLTNAPNVSVSADLMDGNIDILVNIAACKSHNGTGGHFSYGSCTLCMKSHFGTFTSATTPKHSGDLHVPNSASSPPPAPLALFEINKHIAVLGGNPVRQQICIVDALLSNGKSGPGGEWDNRTDRLVMGTFAPIVDYLATNKILLNSTLMSKAPIEALGITNAAIILPQFLTSFGYTAADPDWMEYEAASPPAVTPGTGGSGGSGGSTSAGGSTSSSGAGGTTSSSGKGGSTSAGGSSAKGGTTASNGGSTASNGGSTASNGGSTASNGGSTTSNGGTVGTGGEASGGTNAAGGTTTDNGGTMSNGGTTGAAGGTTASYTSATGGSPATGGTSSSPSTSAAGGHTGPAATSGAAHTTSGSGCDVAGGNRRATRWGAVLAFGAVLAAKFRRLVSDDDRSKGGS
jgi:hypothetical protein